MKMKEGRLRLKRGCLSRVMLPFLIVGVGGYLQFTYLISI